jgi:hypothetical protein
LSFADTIRQNGFSGKLMFDVMAWNGNGSIHRVSRYLSTDPAVIKNQLSLIKLAGGAGVRVTWEGPSSHFVHQATLQICEQCSEMGLLFSLMIDTWVNGQANWWLDPGFLMMLNSDCYIPEKFLCDFSTGIDYTKVALPAGFSVLLNQQGFGWANAHNGANAQTLAELQNTNKMATMKWPFLSLAFCDAGVPTPPGVTVAAFTGTREYGQSVWSPPPPATPQPARAIDHQAGNMFFDCVAALALCPSAPYCAMVWNDADEQTGCEHFMATFFNVRLGK